MGRMGILRYEWHLPTQNQLWIASKRIIQATGLFQGPAYLPGRWEARCYPTG